MAARSKRVKNPMGLTLPGSERTFESDNERNESADSEAATSDASRYYARQPSPNEQIAVSDSAGYSIEQLQYEFSQLECTDSQKMRMNKFFEMKKAVGVVSNDTIENVSEIGQGASGTVWLARCKQSDVIMARKVIHLDVKPSVRMQVMRELEVLHKCNCPYIVGFYGAFVFDGRLSMCMEYMDGGSLDKLQSVIPRVPENILAHVACAVLCGLSYMREKHQYIHRDVKPSNILVNTDGEIKLCDFSVSGKLVDSMANTFIGTRSYMSPERLDGSRYTVQSDIWSLGISLVELAIGKYPIPFPPQTYIEEVMRQDPLSRRKKDSDKQNTMAIFELLGYIFNADPPQLPSQYFSAPFCQFVSTCLKKKAAERTDLKTLRNMEFTRQSTMRDQCQEVGHWVAAVKELTAESIRNTE